VRSDQIKQIKMNYAEFMAQPVIELFCKNMGKVFVATENRGVSQILSLYEAGHRHFCEKYVQETLWKWSELGEIRAECVLHNFGYVQKNKLKKSMDYFDGVESIDRETLVDKVLKLKRECPEARATKFYIQINVGNEPQKKGVLNDQADRFIEEVLGRGLAIEGVMGIPPKDQNPIPYFKRLRRLKDQFGLQECVMGMSQDYERAIECGSTHIRVARVIFATVSRVLEVRV